MAARSEGTIEQVFARSRIGRRFGIKNEHGDVFPGNPSRERAPADGPTRRSFVTKTVPNGSADFSEGRG